MEFPWLVLIPVIAGLSTQLLKLIILVLQGKFRWSSIQEYGGMPSAHTAFVVAVTTVAAKHEGVNSVAFAIAFIFSLLIIRDAIGMRRFLGRHAQVINMLVKDLPDDIEEKYPRHLVEQVGHTPAQAFVGGLLGLGIALALYQLWFGV